MAKAGRTSEYKSLFAERLDGFSENPESLVVRGNISDTKVASLFDVSRETVRKWRSFVPGRESEFKPEFAAAWKKCQSALDTGAVKQSMIQRATGFTQVKKVRERINVGPEIPGLSAMTASRMIGEAKRVLDMDIDPAQSNGDIENEIRNELYRREKTKLVVVKEEKVTMAGDVPAAKLVLNNIDTGAAKWSTADKVENDVTFGGLAELFKKMDGSGMGLPCDDDE